MKDMCQQKFNRAATAAFTGHRFYDFSQRGVIKSRLTKAILDAYYQGIRNFISGFAMGFDLTAASVVQSLKLSHPDIMLIAAIPFMGQSVRYNPKIRMMYERLLELADEVVVLNDNYYPRCFLDRDVFMVENASCLIAFYDGRERGGTYYTIKNAKARDIPIINVYE